MSKQLGTYLEPVHVGLNARLRASLASSSYPSLSLFERSRLFTLEHNHAHHMGEKEPMIEAAETQYKSRIRPTSYGIRSALLNDVALCPPLSRHVPPQGADEHPYPSETPYTQTCQALWRIRRLGTPARLEPA